MSAAWRAVKCGCCGGVEWGGEYPRECSTCRGGGWVWVLPSGVAALYPGGPFIGSGWKREYVAAAVHGRDARSDEPSPSVRQASHDETRDET